VEQDMTAGSPLHAADIIRLETHHNALLELCLQLEDAAEDVTTGAATAFDYQALAKAIPALLSEAHLLEETVLFPDFDHHAGSGFATVVIERLKAEHRCDRLSAEELAGLLQAVSEGQCQLAADTVAYMIRGFLESLRRHILSENLMLEALLAAKSEKREVFG
jgi:hemerythrin-like domain-containing protein